MIIKLKTILPGYDIESAELVPITGISITTAAESALMISKDNVKLFDGYIYRNDVGGKLLFLVPNIKWTQGGAVPDDIMNCVNRLETAELACWVYTRNSYFLFVDDWANIESLDMKVV